MRAGLLVASVFAMAGFVYYLCTPISHPLAPWCPDRPGHGLSPLLTGASTSTFKWFTPRRFDPYGVMPRFLFNSTTRLRSRNRTFSTLSSPSLTFTPLLPILFYSVIRSHSNFTHPLLLYTSYARSKACNYKTKYHVLFVFTLFPFNLTT